MGSLWGSLTMITKKWNPSLCVMRNVVTLPRVQILDRSWLESSFPRAPIRAWRFPKPPVVWYSLKWAQRQDIMPHSAQNSAAWTKHELLMILSGIALRQSSSFQFSGYADVSVLLKPTVMVWNRTELPSGIRHVVFFSTLLSSMFFLFYFCFVCSQG